MKKFAIIGAGFCGMALCWHMRKIFPDALIDLFDKNPIGENTSGASTGLLHAFVGKSAKKSLYADVAIESALPMLHAAQKHIHEKMYSQNGLFRVALNKDQEGVLFELAEKHKEVEYLSAEKASKMFSNLITNSGLFIKNAITVKPVEYLKGLFLDLKNNGVRFFQQNVNKDDLKDYDIKIFCTGHNIDFLNNRIAFKGEKIKGQMLICKWPANLPRLRHSVCGNGHITVFDQTCYLGSTYEHNFDNDKTDESALKLIDKIKTFFPLAERLEVIDIKAGIRIKRKGHYFPYIARPDDKSFIFSHLGSRGLLYHSYLAKKLAISIKANNLGHLPKECLAPNA